MTTMLSTGCDLNAQLATTTGTFDRTLSVSGPITLTVTTGSGDIAIRPGPDGAVHVTGRIRAHESLVGGLSATEKVARLTAAPPIAQDGASVRIGAITDQALQNNVSIDYEITVPAATRVESRSGSGDQTVGALNGPVDVSTGSGDVKVGPVKGNATIKTGSGEIELLGATGEIEMRAGSGDLRASAVSGRVAARTASGDIQIEGTPTGDWSVGAASGDITLRLPADAAFSIDASTSSGGFSATHRLDVVQQSKHQLSGTAHGGGPRLKVSTASGDIRLD